MWCVETISKEETYPPQDSNIWWGTNRFILVLYITDGDRYRKTVNAFGISRASISGIIRSVSYIVTTFVGPKLMRLPTSTGVIKLSTVSTSTTIYSAAGDPLYISLQRSKNVATILPRPRCRLASKAFWYVCTNLLDFRCNPSLEKKSGECAHSSMPAYLGRFDTKVSQMFSYFSFMLS